MAAAVWLCGVAAPAAACTVSASVTSTLGTYSPAAVQAGVVPALQSRAGIVCPSGVLVLLGGNYLRATFGSTNGFKLVQQGGTVKLPYGASADQAGTTPFVQGATIDYMQNNLLNLLGLLGGSSADVPLFVKPGATATPPPLGSYTDRITIDWSWNMCPGIGLLGLCIGVPDTGTGQSVLDVSLIVSPQGMIVSITSAATWDPTDGAINPKALPGGRQRMLVTVTNPDIVPIEPGTIAIVLPTSPSLTVALDGDGVSVGDAIRMSEGAPASGVTLRYGGGADATDDIDFSADQGASWSYAPSATLVSERAITHVRLRPQGVMAKQSSFSVSVPYLVN